MVKRCIVYSPTGSILLNDAPEGVFFAFESWLKGGSPAYWIGEHNAKPVAINFQHVSCNLPAGRLYLTVAVNVLRATAPTGTQAVSSASPAASTDRDPMLP